MKRFIETSPTLAMNALVLEKKRRGERVYNLGVGEAMVEPPPVVVEAAARAMKEGKTRYTPSAGIPELCRAAGEWMGRAYAAPYAPEETVVTCGGKFALFALLRLLVSPGDEAIIFSPYWPSYPAMVRLAGAVPVVAHGFFDTERIRTDRARVLIVNNACNPTGVLYQREALERALVFAKQHDLFVISDEVYSGLAYDHEFISIGSFPAYRDRVAVVQSCSKHFAMTGWRVGLLFAPKEIAAAAADFQSQTTSGTSTISQWAALAAIEHAGEILPGIRDAVRARRDVFVETWNRLFPRPIDPPASGLYAFIPLSSFGASSEETSESFCHRALLESGVAMMPGLAFGAEGFVRCSFGEREEEIASGLHALAAWIGNKKTPTASQILNDVRKHFERGN